MKYTTSDIENLLIRLNIELIKEPSGGINATSAHETRSENDLVSDNAVSRILFVVHELFKTLKSVVVFEFLFLKQIRDFLERRLLEIQYNRISF